jgi:hypothetical protein
VRRDNFTLVGSSEGVMLVSKKYVKAVHGGYLS